MPPVNNGETGEKFERFIPYLSVERADVIKALQDFRLAAMIWVRGH